MPLSLKWELKKYEKFSDVFIINCHKYGKLYKLLLVTDWDRQNLMI